MKRKILLILLVLVAAVGAVSAQGDERPFLGITFDEDENGVVITSVLDASPADEAGLQTGDVITAINDEEVTVETLAETVQAMAVGDTITLNVMRDGSPETVEATLSEQPENSTIEIAPMRRAERAYLGVSLANGDGGVTVESVTEGTAADEAGLQAGDIITAINDEAVESSFDVVSIVRSSEPGETLTLSITRDGEEITVETTLGATSGFTMRMQGMDDVILFDGENWQVVALSEDSPLTEAGLQAGDIITLIDGERYDPQALAGLLEENEGDVTLTVERDGESLELTIAASALDALSRFGPFGGPMPFGFHRGLAGNTRLGVQFVTLDENTAAENNVDVTEGALITNVLDDTPAAEAGLQTGDVIVSVNDEPVDAERTLRDRLFAYEPDDTVTLEVLRDGETLTVEVTLTGGFDPAILPFPHMDRLPFESNKDGVRHLFGSNV